MPADPEPIADERNGASARSRGLLTGALLVLTLIFIALGSWQVQRLFWKLELIARVETRIHADPVPAPMPSAWASVNAERDEYRRVHAAGAFDHGKAVLVQAVTERGAGFWVMTPLMRDDGSTILVNRGFVPADRRDPKSRQSGDVSGNITVTGLLRMSEPGGGFLRSNDPANGRWFSRDVAAIGAAQGLSGVAPYFIDADATPNPGGLPVGGLTVVNFRNSHLVYALTWYGLAAMSLAGIAILRRQTR